MICVSWHSLDAFPQVKPDEATAAHDRSPRWNRLAKKKRLSVGSAVLCDRLIGWTYTLAVALVSESTADLVVCRMASNARGNSLQ